MRRLKSVGVLLVWLLLMGCDDDQPSKTIEGKNGVTYTMTADEPGCDDNVKTGTIEGSDGSRGKIKLEWEYVIWYYAAFGFLALFLFRQRPARLTR